MYIEMITLNFQRNRKRHKPNDVQFNIPHLLLFDPIAITCILIKKKSFVHILQLSSTTSMSFLRDENLTFHRFTTDDSRRPSDDINSNGSTPRRSTLIIPHEEPERNFSPTVWTTTTSSSKSNYTTGTNEFHYIPGAGVHDISTKALQLQNGSTVKLLPSDDQTNKQVRILFL